MVMLFDKSGSKLHTIEVIRAEISQELNGEYRCSIEVPAWIEIEAEQIVELLDADGTVQKFRLTQPIRGIETTRADGWHITQDLANDLILNRAWLTQTAAQAWPELLQAGISERRFTGASDIATVAPLRIVRLSVLQAAIGDQDNSFTNRFGGELERNNFTVNLKSRLGADRGFRVSFARNMQSVSIDEDSADIVNRIVPTFLNASNAAVTLPETYIDSALIGNTATPHVKHVHYSDIKVLAEDLDGNIAYPTIESAQAEVRARVAKLYADGIDQPRLTVDVDFLLMRDINEQIDSPLETVLLGDTVQVVLGLDSYTERLVSYTWDCLTKEYTRTILGQPYRSVGSMVAQIEAAAEAATDEKIENDLIPSLTQARLDLINAAAQASGYFTTTVLNPDGSARIYFHDDPVLADSTKIEYYPEPGTKVYTKTGWNSGDPVWQYGTTDGDLVVGTLTAQVIQVQNEFDAIEIGGRNLIQSSMVKQGATQLNTTEFTISGWSDLLISNTDTLAILKEGETYTMSYEMELVALSDCPTWYSESSGLYLYSMATTNNVDFLRVMNTLGSKLRVEVTFVCPPLTDQMIIFYTGRKTTYGGDPIGLNTVKFTNLKLEKGNIATDWTPAPEDVDASVAKVQTNLTNLSGSLKSLAYLDMVEKAKLGTTVIEGGYLKSDLIQAESLVIGKFAPTAIKGINDKIAVGGRNLLSDTEGPFEVIKTDASGYYDAIAKQTINIPDGKEYILSFKAKASAPMVLHSFFFNPNTTTRVESSTGYIGNEVDGTALTNITTEWDSYWIKWNQSETVVPKTVIIARILDAFDNILLEIKEIKLEKGNKPTDWTPAPEDMATKAGLAQTNYTTINGGNIVTGLIKSGNGYSQINLDDGSFNFANGGFTYNPVSGAILAGWEVSPTQLRKEAAGTGGSYAKVDCWTIEQYVRGFRTFTPSEFAFYNVNGDDRISISDITRIEYMFLFGNPNPDVLNYKLVLDPSNGNSFILGQAIWPATGEVIRETKIGAGTVEANALVSETVESRRVSADEFRVGKDGGNTYGVTETFTTIEGMDVTATKGIVTDVSNTAKTKLTVPLPAEFSQVPTVNGHSIIDSGSNTNGSYIRFSDGTQICYRGIGNITGLSIANGSYWTSGAYAFPAAFTGNPINHISCFVADSADTPRNAVPIPHYASNWQWFISNTSGGTITQLLTVSLLAIGRWK